MGADTFETRARRIFQEIEKLDETERVRVLVAALEVAAPDVARADLPLELRVKLIGPLVPPAWRERLALVLRDLAVAEAETTAETGRVTH